MTPTNVAIESDQSAILMPVERINNGCLLKASSPSALLRVSAPQWPTLLVIVNSNAKWSECAHLINSFTLRQHIAIGPGTRRQCEHHRGQRHSLLTSPHCPIGVGKVSIWVHAIHSAKRTKCCTIKKGKKRQGDKVATSPQQRVSHLMTEVLGAQKKKSALVVYRY